VVASARAIHNATAQLFGGNGVARTLGKTSSSSNVVKRTLLVEAEGAGIRDGEEARSDGEINQLLESVFSDRARAIGKG
jgi:hypothetical protein